MSSPPSARAYAWSRAERLTQCALGLTLYTRHAGEDCARGPARLLASFLELVSPTAVPMFRTSLTPAWKRLRPDEHPVVAEELRGRTLVRRPRHLFELHLADRTDAPAVFFSYREADEARGAGAGYLQLGLPVDAPPASLFQLVMEAAHHVPMWGGVGGYVASLHPADPCSSLSAVWAWAKRYWGLDVQQPDRARLLAPEGLPSVNWLTLVGAPLLASRDADRARLSARAHELELDWLDAADAAVVRAGEAPTLGDGNRMQHAPAYARAHALLAPLLLPQPVRLYGKFWEDDAAARWTERFADPEAWNA